MSAILLSLAAAWVVLRVFGADRPLPARFVELERPPELGATSPEAGRRSRSVVGSSRPRMGGHAGRSVDHAAIAGAVDLLGVAVSAGHSLQGAVAVVAASGPGRVPEAFAEVDRRVRDGGSLASALAALVERLGEPARPLTAALSAALSSGSAVAPQLQRIADGERARERRRREEGVRRLPVLLLAPLVGLILPAFVLLAVVPVALTSIRPLTASAPISATPSVHGPLPSEPPSVQRSGEIGPQLAPSPPLGDDTP